MLRPASAWPEATHRSMTNEDEILVLCYWQRQALLEISQRMAAMQVGEAFVNKEHAHAAMTQHTGDAAATVPDVPERSIA